MNRRPEAGQAVLPPLYRRWVDEFLRAPILEERRATCADCAMLRDDKPPPAPAWIYFNPETKCCTYVPELPNYLVGRILADRSRTSRRGRATLATRLESGVGVTPLGIAPSPVFTLAYTHHDEAFGRAVSLRCPHYLAEEGGKCGIWKHRAGVCATWFCKHNRGAAGLRFWRALDRLLREVESSLAMWCLLELGVEAKALEHLSQPTPADVDGKWPPEVYREMWGRWAGREAAFYRACASRVRPLDWARVAAIGGAEVRLLAAVVRDAFTALRSEEPPPALRPGPFTILGMGPEVRHIQTYSGFDPLEAPARLLDALPYFDGRTTEEAIAVIGEQQGVEIDKGLVRKLADFEILTPAGDGV